MGPIERRVFATWFTVFTACIFLIDCAALDLWFWPPAPVKRVLRAYSETLDPLFLSGNPPWHRAAILVELLVYPPYHYAAVRRLRGSAADEWASFLPWTAVYVTCVLYSFVVIVAENFGGDDGVVPPYPIAYFAVYGPFMVVPVVWAVRVWQVATAEQVGRSAVLLALWNDCVLFSRFKWTWVICSKSKA